MTRSHEGLALASVALVSLALATAPAATATDLADRVRERWSADEFSIERIALPEGLPEAWSVTVDHHGTSVTLDLHRRSLRAPSFRLRAWADGSTREIEPPPFATYQGRVRGDAATVAGGTLTAAGLSLGVFPRGRASWSIRPLLSVAAGAAREVHLILDGGDWPAGLTCGADDAKGPGETPANTAREPSPREEATGAAHSPTEAPGPAGSTTSSWCGPGRLTLTQIAFDVDQVYFRDLGSDLAATTANVEGHLAEVDAFYARDALITYELTDLIIRTTDFYLPDPTTGSLLDLFQQEWNTNQTGVVRDIAHLMTGQPAPGLGGLAYVGVVCNLSWCYGWSVDSSGVLGHEVGHNWNAGHCHDVTPCNNMCGACLYIAPNTKDIITAFRDDRTCLDDVGPYADPVPPYPHPDRVAITRTEADTRATIAVDVLANDHDANCDDLRIDSFDAVSARRAGVARDTGGGTGGRDRLLYTPPCMMFAGLDRFDYTLDDGAGGGVAGDVSVAVLDPGLVALWPLDDGSGTVAADATGWARDGTLASSPAWTTGRRGGALELNGADQHVTVPPLDLAGLPVTMTAWVRRNGAEPPFAGLVFSRGGSTTAGLHLGDASDLRYTWAGDPNTWGRSSGLVLPDGTWTFVALVVEASRAVLGIDDGSGWRSWENAIPHDAQGFDATTALGWDPTSPARHFAGALDDVRVYDVALDVAEILAIRDGGARAEAPRPADGGFVPSGDVVLSWRPAAGASERDVFFGESYAAVRDATPADPEYQGRATSTTLALPGLLAEGFTYTWRVDEVVAGTPVKGEPWIFTVRGRTTRLLHAWRLDEGTGTSTIDQVGGLSAELRNGASWSSGRLDGAVILDGVDDVVAAPLPGSTLSEATFTAWLRTSGATAPWAGLVFTRDGGATGLGFRDTSELGYHWGDGQWWWSSGLVVPPDTWVFVALTVSAGSATIYLEDGNGWQSATNLTNHGLVPWTGELLLGRDPWGTPRSFAGALDDVRVYDRALLAAEVRTVHDEPSRASNPMPTDGSALLVAPATLAWVGGSGAAAHELYVGGDLAAVRLATPASPEFRGLLTAPLWTPPQGLLAGGRTWYWRVDERTAQGVTTGTVWRFLMTGDVGGSLLARKAAGGQPQILWPAVSGTESYEIQRCAPAGAGGCVPLAVATVGAGSRAWQDPAAIEPLVWYRVAARPCLP